MDISGKLIQGTGTYEVKEGVINFGEQVTSGYNLSATDWGVTSGAITFAAGVASFDDSANSQLYQTAAKCPIYPDRAYTISFTIAGGGGGRFAITDDAIDNVFVVQAAYANADYSIDFTTNSATTGGLRFLAYTSGTLFTISKISIKPYKSDTDKYLECTSAGTVAFASDQVFGEWEFDCYKALDANRPDIQFISPKVDVWTEVTGYGFLFDDAEGLYIEKYDGAGSAEVLLGTAASYITIEHWYRIKVTRTLDGVFTAYVKGGAYGITDWVLLTAGLGSNPTAADLIYTTSEYFVLDFGVGDRIANIIMRKAVAQ